MPTAQEIFKYIVGKVSTNGADLRLEDTAEDKEIIENLIDRWKNLKEEKDKQMFQKILSDFCTLILKYEKNGIAQDHAEKLNYLFHSPASAARWLFEYSLHTDSTAPLHDLCLHIIKTDSPMPPLYYFGEGNLTRMFTHMNHLRVITQYHSLIAKDKKEWRTTRIDDLVKEIKKDLDKNELSQQGIDLEKLSEEKKHQLKKIQEYNLRFKLSQYDNAKEILDTLNNAKNSDAYLPSFIMTCESIGLSPGYYFTKLKENDVRNLMAGHFTGCCQHVGGQGEKCAIHSVTSEFGATYVLMKGKIEDGKTKINLEHDPLIAVSWAWASYNTRKKKVDAAGFDSIEYDKKAISDLVKANEALNLALDQIFRIIYSEAAHQMLVENSDLQKIVVGIGGRTPSGVGDHPISIHDSRLLTPWNDSLSPYNGYRDSEDQLILSSRIYSDYYRIHKLNSEKLIPELVKIQDNNLQYAMVLNYKDLIQNPKEPPEWLHMLNIYSWERAPDKIMEAVERMPDSGADLSVFLPNKLTSVAMYLISKWLYENKILNNLKVSDINTGSSESTVLIKAIELRDMKLLERLLDKGGDPNLADSLGNTFVHHLFLYGCLILSEIPVEWLKNYNFNMTIKNDGNLTPLKLLEKMFFDMDSDDHSRRIPADWLDYYSEVMGGQMIQIASRITSMEELDKSLYLFYPVKEWAELIITKLFELLKTKWPAYDSRLFVLKYLVRVSNHAIENYNLHSDEIEKIHSFIKNKNIIIDFIKNGGSLRDIEKTLSLLKSSVIPSVKTMIKNSVVVNDARISAKFWNQSILLLENDPEKTELIHKQFDLMRISFQNEFNKGYTADLLLYEMFPSGVSHPYAHLLINYIHKNPGEAFKYYPFNIAKYFYIIMFNALDFKKWPELFLSFRLSFEDLDKIIRVHRHKVNSHVQTLNDLNRLLNEVEGDDNKELIGRYIRLINIPEKDSAIYSGQFGSCNNFNDVDCYNTLITLFSPDSYRYEYLGTEANFNRKVHADLLNFKQKMDHVVIQKILLSHLNKIQHFYDEAQPSRGFTPTLLEYKLMRSIHMIGVADPRFYVREPHHVVFDDNSKCNVNRGVW